MTIASPVLLWAMAGLAIPVAIHMLSRKEGKVLKLGSLRHVEETSTQQFRGIRLNEIALLLLRSALIMTFCFILAGIFIPASQNAKWVLIEKGLEEQPRIAAVVDSLAGESYEPHWLMTGFPDFPDSVAITGRIRYRELVVQLGKRNLSSVVVFAKNKPTSFTGVPMPLSDNVRWIGQPAGKNEFTVQSFRITPDSVVRRHGHSDANATTFEYSSGTANDSKLIQQPIVSVGLIADSKYQPDKRIVKAALKALEGMVPVKIILQEVPDKAIHSDWVVWMSDKEPPSGKIIRLNPSEVSSILVKTGQSEWQLTKRLNEYIAIQSNLALELARIIVPLRSELEAAAAVHDERMIPDSVAWSSSVSVTQELKGAVMSGDTAEPFLLLIFFAMLVSERILAYHRKQ